MCSYEDTGTEVAELSLSDFVSQTGKPKMLDKVTLRPY